MRIIRQIEWKTLSLVVACYAAWCALMVYHATFPSVIWVLLVSVILAFYSSLQHELIHGHPTTMSWLNDALGMLPLGLFVAYPRYRDTHRQHHDLEFLTQPHQDPESFYFSAQQWHDLSGWQKQMYRWNNRLSGRLLLGPMLNLMRFWRAEIAAMRQSDRAIRVAWFSHVLLVIPIAVCLSVFDVNGWGYLLASYLGLSWISIRSFAEHRAVDVPEQRSLIVEQRCPLSALYLNNSLHYVHHKYPGLPWYELRPLYEQNREQFLQENGGYVVRSYAELFKRYLFTVKEPVQHPSGQ